MKISWEAALQGANCIRIDDDGASKVLLTSDQSQVSEVIKLILARGKTVHVTVEILP